MFGGSRRRSWLCVGASLAVAVAVAGCGDDDSGESRAQERPKFAASSEPEDVFIKRVAKLLETTATKKDCAQLEEVNGRSFTRFSCPPGKGLRKSMASFKVVGAEDYGTGAVVDYKSGEIKDGAAIVLFVAPDRNWGIGRFGILTKPSIGTSDEESREGYDEAVDDYLAAVRERDCKRLEQAAFSGDTDEQAACKVLLAGTEALAKRLKANPSAEPSYAGGNGTYGFYTLETRKPEPENSTISVVRGDERGDESFVVLDVAPSPTAAEQLRVEREYRRQQRNESGPGMAPDDASVKPTDSPNEGQQN
jgi:hypothetical protein